VTLLLSEKLIARLTAVLAAVELLHSAK